MSTKNIALNSKVYSKLAQHKDESESFSKTIERLLSRLESDHTGADILQQLAGFSPLSEGESDTMLKRVAQNRKSETWESHDLS